MNGSLGILVGSLLSSNRNKDQITIYSLLQTAKDLGQIKTIIVRPSKVHQLSKH